MAVGIIIGGAFGKIITSLVNDVIMPPLGVLIGGVNFTDLKITLKAAEGDLAAVTLNYGHFLQVCFDFLIIAFSIFCFVRLLSKLKSKKEQEQAPAAPPAPSKEEVLLSDRVIVLSNGKIVLDDKPHNVFLKEDLLLEIGLDVPFMYKIKNALIKNNINVKDTTSLEEIGDILCR